MIYPFPLCLPGGKFALPEATSLFHCGTFALPEGKLLERKCLLFGKDSVYEAVVGEGDSPLETRKV